MTALYFAIAFLFIAVIGLGIGFFILARQIGILFERIAPMGALVNDSGPRVGDTSPTFDLPSLTGGKVLIGKGANRAKLIFFLSPTCPVCKKLLPILRSVRDSEGNWLDVVLASDGEADKHQRFINHTGLTDFPYVLSTELGLGYRVSRLPFAVLLDSNGVITSKGLINSREQLESLFNAHEMGVGSIQGYLENTQA
ncbi:methylamine dehydrogenase accessory protein MauD [Pokkaliibacter sp. MBI-7]|uniref:methylamine dehydrogenase accessory protein MauD n=1 Tax=Pokkaliibacter sp. MBI-7 TaxID=3040600 RepID=UPI00244A8855|nr:methylamine dehydrogenase accessory protein MauD [Pokkaliibacter sp. MBI-7]MDH2432344.1 methylamine dehydrogenase accessory protein MauD [Pokkaliibacter sp. MBI-7]